MNNKKENKQLKLAIASVLLAAAMAPGIASAQTSTAPELKVLNYSDDVLRNAGCDPNNWRKLVNDYLAKRGYERQVEFQYQVKDQMLAAAQPNAPGTAGACIENAMKTVENAMTSVDALMKIFSGGGPDFGMIGGRVMDSITNAACTQVTTYVNNATYGFTSPINNVTGAINNAGINTNIPGVGYIDLGGTIKKDPNATVGSTVGGLFGGGSTSTTGVPSTSVPWYQKINPFRSASDALK